uniref:Cirhin n=1 Tax=Cacopsylla melanoneura TaxID=428564 RepID=A0A8D8ZE93_9HEMI
MGTYGVHNIKFYNPEPKSISCIACEPKSSRLAVARADHSIEIWDVSETPHVDRVFVGDAQSNSIECLTWFNDRLFSGGVQGFIHEYDMRRLKIKASTAVTSGTCWCLAVHKKKRLLAAGTEQGHINLFQISDEGLLYEKLLDRQQGRILCTAWHSSGDLLVTGCTSAVRIWDIHKGHALHKMTLDKTNRFGKRSAVWCVSFLADYTIITGDAGGFLRFWDGKSGVQRSEVKTHKRDILAMTLSEDENLLYCAGVDPTVVCFQRTRKAPLTLKSGPDHSILNKGQQQSGLESSGGLWVRSVNRLLHEGDVKSLSVHGGKLYAGGLDSYLSLSYYPPKTLVKYPCTLAQTTPVSVAKDIHHLLLQYAAHLELWSLGAPQPPTTAAPAPGLQPLASLPQLVLRLSSRNNVPIRTSVVSNDGKWVAYAAENYVRLHTLDLDGDKPHLSRVKSLPGQLTDSVATHLVISADSSVLVTACLNGPLVVLDLATLQLKYTMDPYKSNLMSDVISHVQISECKQYIVCADRKSHVVVWKHEQHHASLPRYRKPPTALAIHPALTSLLVVYSDHRILEFDLVRKAFTPFSRKLESNHPKEWLSRQVPVMGIDFDAQDSSLIYLIDDSALCVINKNKSLAHADAKIPRLGPKSGSGDSSNSTHVMESKVAFHFVRRNKHTVYFGSLNNREMVSVQVNPLSFMEKLPPTWSKKQYGVS